MKDEKTFKQQRRKLLDKLKLTKLAIKIIKIDGLKDNPDLSKEKRTELVQEQISLIKTILNRLKAHKTVYISLMICEGLLITSLTSGGILSACEQEYLQTLIFTTLAGIDMYHLKDVLGMEMTSLNSTKKVFEQALDIANTDLNEITGNNQASL